MQPSKRYPFSSRTMAPAGLSLLLPGLGQAVQRRWARGCALFFTIAALSGLLLWQKQPLLFIPLAAIWLWGAWDAFRYGQGRTSGTALPFLMATAIVYALAIQATHVDLRLLLTNWPAARPVVSALVQPELFDYPKEERIGSRPFQVPCVEPLPPAEGNPVAPPTLQANVPCASPGDTITVEGEGLFPNLEAEVWWQNPIGDYQRIIGADGNQVMVTSDAQGRFQVRFAVPLHAVPQDRLPGPGETQTHRIEVRQYKPYDGLQPTQTLRLVLEKIGETIALAFIATVLAVFLALPVSFLAARNLMGGHLVTRLLYYLVRTVLNIIRSVETLIWAIIFAAWVGLGPFAGTLALLFHSIAALGKLYSESIEAIDPGPIEALRATGANWFQVAVYAVLPQFMPSFLSFTLLRWDINVRMSTVIGLVSDAGLGFLVVQWVRLGRYNSMATSIIAIVLIIIILDYVSAYIRKRVVEGTPTARAPLQPGPGWRACLRWRWEKYGRYALPAVLTAAFAAMFVWSWRTAQIDPGALVRDAPTGLRIARDMVVPEILTQPTEATTATAVLPVPCGSAQPIPPPSNGPRVSLSLPCGSPGDTLIISGRELPPHTRVSVRWIPPTGGWFPVKRDCCDTDDQGSFDLETKIRPVMEFLPTQGHAGPGAVAVVWTHPVGSPVLSDALKTVLELSYVTLLMALLATTLGAIIAVPLSFLAASNIMGRSIVGRVVYNLSRLIFNLWRSVEPMILALICALWVYFGPFAGTLALALWSIPNLAKLFYEAIEAIDPGPMEAVTATGANRLQTLLYAAIPQLVPLFLAFILYQWDINIRMSTVIGFVGGGGIGRQLRQWIELDEYAKAATALWAIVAMVWSMDYISAKVREKLT